MTRKLRLDFERSIAADAKTAPKKFWSYVNSRTKTRSTIPSLVRKDGSEAKTAEEKADVLNKFFGTTFTVEDTSNVPESSDATYQGSYLNTFKVSPDMVLIKLRELNPGKTPGLDGWHPLLLKNLADVLALPLSLLFQKSLDEGLLPEDWLKA